MGMRERLERLAGRLRGWIMDDWPASLIPLIALFVVVLAVLAGAVWPRGSQWPAVYVPSYGPAVMSTTRLINSTDHTVLVSLSLGEPSGSGLSGTEIRAHSTYDSAGYAFTDIDITIEFTDPRDCTSLGSVTLRGAATIELPASGPPVVKSNEGPPMPTPGGTIPPLSYSDVCADTVGLEGAAWRHQGSLIGIGDDQGWFIEPQGTLMRVAGEGERVENLKELSDGSVIASRPRPGSTSGTSVLWRTDRRGSSWQAWDMPGMPTASADGRWFAYTSSGPTPADSFALHVIRPDGSGDIDLGNRVEDFVWAPDSSRLAVLVNGDAPDYEGRLEIWGVDGSKKVVRNKVDAYAGLDWSPRSDRLAVTADDGGRSPNQRLLIVDESGTQLAELTPGKAGVRATEILDGVTYEDRMGCPKFSPDGTKLAFLRITYPYPNNAEVDDVYVAAVDGTGATLITDHGYSGTPVWSPDGSWLAVTRSRGDDDSTYVTFVAHPDGSGYRLIAHGLWVTQWVPD